MLLGPKKPEDSFNDPLCSSAKSDAPCKEAEATEDFSEHCDVNTGDLRKKSLDEKVHKQHGDALRVNLKPIHKHASMASFGQEDAGDARSIVHLPSPIALSDMGRPVLLDDDDCIPDELRYSSADNGTVVAYVTNQWNTAKDGVILDSSTQHCDLAESSIESADDG